MSRQVIEIEGTFNPTLDIGVVLVDTENSPSTITLPNIENSTADDIKYKLLVQDAKENASNNKITINAAGSDLVNGVHSIEIDTNGGGIVFEPFANKYWVAYPSQGGGAGASERIGVIEVPITLFQSGSTYYGKMASGFTTLLGDGSNFQITQNAGANNDTIKSTSNIIQNVDLIYYFQCISQGSNRRAFGSLFAGARATGGAVSPAIGQNNFRFPLPMGIGFVAAGDEIRTNISWSGVGVLTLNGATMYIYFIY